MTVYIVAFAVLSSLSIIELIKRGHDWVHLREAGIWLCFLFLLIFAGLRWETGNDWSNYHDYYLSLVNLTDKKEDFEVGYRMFAYFFKSIGFNYSSFLLISTFTYLTFFFIVFRNQKAPLLVILLFYSTYLLGWMGTARQVLAVGLTLIAGELLLKNRIKAFVICVLIASAFHQTAILFLLAYFFRRPVQPFCRYAMMLLCAYFVGIALPFTIDWFLEHLAGIEGVSQKLRFYSQVNAKDLNFSSGNIIVVLWYLKRLVFLFVFFIFRNNYSDPIHSYYFNCYFASVVCFLIFQPILPILALRASNYFSLYELILLATLAVRAKQRWKFAAFAMIIILSAQRLYTSLFSYHPDLFIPYKGLIINDSVSRDLY